MYKNYFITALRNISRNKLYTAINIIGLAIGLAIGLLLFLYVQFEYSFENCHNKSNQIYRIIKKSSEDQEAKTGLGLVQLIKSEFPEVKKTVRVAYLPEIRINHNNEIFAEKRLIFSDPEIFDVFSYKLLVGDPKSVLSEPNSIVISKEIAVKYFGRENPMGKTIGDDIQLKVTGILDKMPDNSHLRFDMVTSMETIKNWINPKTWEWNGNSYTYVLLPYNYPYNTLVKKLGEFEKKINISKILQSYHYDLEPLKKIHLHSRCFTALPDLSMKFNDVILYLLVILGSLIITIACINTINLSIVRSITRSKEVGVRKVLGSSRGKIIHQFLSEYFILTLITLSLAYVIVELLLPFISEITNREISVDYLKNLPYILGSLAILTIVTLASGLYTSLVLSRLNPIHALKNSIKTPKGTVFRKLLTVCQFVTSLILVLVSYFIFKIERSYSEGHLGFNQDNLIVIQMFDGKIRNSYFNLKSELIKIPGVAGVTASSNEPSVQGWDYYKIKVDSKEEGYINYISIDEDYLTTLGIKSVDGNAIKNLNGKDNFIINEEAKSQFNLKESIGRNLCLTKIEDESHQLQYQGKIIGIVQTFAYRPMYDKLQGVALSMDTSKYYYALIRISPENMYQTIDKIRTVWKSFFPLTPFSYSFLKDDIKDDIGVKLFEKAGNLFFLCASISITVAILGLFALIMFTTQLRIKEIGIRKTFGAPTFKLLILLSRETLRLIIISNIISGALTYLFMKFILMPNVKQIEFSTDIYVWVGLGSIAITLLTISAIVLKTVKSDPIEALRYE